MQPVFMSIDCEETGMRIKQLILGKILNTRLENILAINGGDVVIVRVGRFQK